MILPTGAEGNLDMGLQRYLRVLASKVTNLEEFSVCLWLAGISK
jgi:hypothetical protein